MLLKGKDIKPYGKILCSHYGRPKLVEKIVGEYGAIKKGRGMPAFRLCGQELSAPHFPAVGRGAGVSASVRR